MQKKTVKFLLISLVAISAIAAYQTRRFNLSIKEKKILNTRLDEASVAKERMQSQLKEALNIASPLKEENLNLKESLEEARAERIELKRQSEQAGNDARNFKQELIEAKTKVKELTKVNPKIEKNLKSTTRKLERTEKNLKSLKQRLTRIRAREITPIKEEVAQLTDSLETKNQEFVLLEGQLKEMTERYDTLNNTNKFLEKQIERLETERLSLQDRLEKVSEQLSRQNGLIPSLRNDLNSLTNVLSQKVLELYNRDKEILSLKGEIANLQSRLKGLEQELAEAGERQIKFVEYFGDLTKLNATLQDKLNQLSQFLDADRLDREKTEEFKRKIEVILEPMGAEEKQ